MQKILMEIFSLDWQISMKPANFNMIKVILTHNSYSVWASISKEAWEDEEFLKYFMKDLIEKMKKRV